MRKLIQTFVAGVAGAVTVIVLIGATTIQTDGDIEAAGLLVSQSGVATPGSIQAGGFVESGPAGFRFADGTVQTTAAAGLATLANTGTQWSIGGCTLLNGEDITDCTSSISVPAGKIFVLEFVSVEAGVPQTQPPPVVDLQGVLSDGSSYVISSVSLRYSGLYAAAERYRWVSQVRAYIQEGEKIGLLFYRNITTGNATANAVVWGYYVDKL